MNEPIRKEVIKLAELGPLPNYSEDGAYSDHFFEEFEALVDSIQRPINAQEASILIKLLPPVSCYGLEWSLLHLIESTPGWPIQEILDQCNSKEWKNSLIKRTQNSQNPNL